MNLSFLNSFQSAHARMQHKEILHSKWNWQQNFIVNGKNDVFILKQLLHLIDRWIYDHYVCYNLHSQCAHLLLIVISLIYIFVHGRFIYIKKCILQYTFSNIILWLNSLWITWFTSHQHEYTILYVDKMPCAECSL